MPTSAAKLVIFLCLPTLAGMVGLYSAYLAQFDTPDRKMTIEADFGLPFMLTLLLVVVVGFQTSGYGSNQVKPLIRWPKKKKTRKVIHKHVVKNSGGDDVDNGAKKID